MLVLSPPQVWRVLADRKPYSGPEHARQSAFQILKQISRGMRPPLDPAWPAPVRGLIARCWAQDAAERPTFAELARELVDAKNGLGLLGHPANPALKAQQA